MSRSDDSPMRCDDEGPATARTNSQGTVAWKSNTGHPLGGRGGIG